MPETERQRGVSRQRAKWDPKSQARKLRDVNLAEELQEVREMVLGEGSAWDMQGGIPEAEILIPHLCNRDGYYT